MKKKIHEQAVARGLAKPKNESVWKREFKPAFTDNFQFSSSEDEEEQEKARKEARAKVREKRKQDRKEHKELRAKLKEVKVDSDD
jgi:F0F1-type ATP synthase epsilon subunit